MASTPKIARRSFAGAFHKSDRQETIDAGRMRYFVNCEQLDVVDWRQKGQRYQLFDAAKPSNDSAKISLKWTGGELSCPLACPWPALGRWGPWGSNGNAPHDWTGGGTKALGSHPCMVNLGPSWPILAASPTCRWANSPISDEPSLVRGRPREGTRSLPFLQGSRAGALEVRGATSFSPSLSHQEQEFSLFAPSSNSHQPSSFLFPWTSACAALPREPAATQTPTLDPPLRSSFRRPAFLSRKEKKVF